MNRQLTYSQTNIVEKVLRDKEGRLVRARFQVYEVAGRVKARLVDFTYIETLTGAVIALAGFIKNTVIEIVNAFDKHFDVPQLTFQTIYTNGSKPRAPTF